MKIKINDKGRDILRILLIIYLLTIPGLNIFILLFLLVKYIKKKEASNSQYEAVSGHTYREIMNDIGLYGEYKTFLQLKRLEGEPKLFTNLYIPKKDGTTTEIDIVMIDETGIYVFESKNFSGWIFGNEKDRNWTQTLKNGQKYRFYNPIWQNKGHIKALQAVIDHPAKELYKSYIVFSERCVLKNITTSSGYSKVLKRNELLDVLKRERLSSPKYLSQEQICNIEAQLRKYCCVSQETKQAHIQNINK